MMVNSAQSGGGGGCMPSPFHSICHHEQSCGIQYLRGHIHSSISPLPFFPLWYRVSLYTLSHINRFTVTSTESTHSGNGHYLAYILSWWKNLPSLVRDGGCTPTPFHYIYAPAEGADKLLLFLLYPYMYSVVTPNTPPNVILRTPLW